MSRGITISQQGIDVEQALDAQKVLDSRWRYLEIAYEKALSLGTITSGITTEVFRHNLGFLPAFDCYNLTTDAYITPNSSGAGLISDNNRIYFGGFFNPAGLSNAKILLRVYNLPIAEEYTAPIQKTLPVSKVVSTRYGVRAVHTGRDINSNELSDFSLHTSAKALAVQQTGLTTANSGTGFEAKVIHNLGNAPSFLATYADIKRNWVGVINPSFIPVLSRADSVKIVFRGAQAALNSTLAYVVLKELGDYII